MLFTEILNNFTVIILNAHAGGNRTMSFDHYLHRSEGMVRLFHMRPELAMKLILGKFFLKSSDYWETDS